MAAAGLECRMQAVMATVRPPSSRARQRPASIAGGLAFLRCEGASPSAATRSTKTHVAHRRIKIERVYRPFLTATEAAERLAQ
jgi:hypothetical protein